jgi:hypothetical protein
MTFGIGQSTTTGTLPTDGEATSTVPRRADHFRRRPATATSRRTRPPPTTTRTRGARRTVAPGTAEPTGLTLADIAAAGAVGGVGLAAIIVFASACGRPPPAARTAPAAPAKAHLLRPRRRNPVSSMP